MNHFQTLSQHAVVDGIGLHTGAGVRAGIAPRDECGIVFVRIDLPEKPEVPASARCIGSTLHATTLECGEAKVSTPEHLLAALWALGITHATVELDGPEVPILDGSAKVWCDLLLEAGIKSLPGARPEYFLNAPVLVSHGDGCVLGLPFEGFRVTADVEYSVNYLATQVFACTITPQAFHKELSPARTFTLEEWIEPLRAQNLIRGGSVENALVLSKQAPSSEMRFANELARHKAIDVVGDLSLLFGENGGVLHAHIIAARAGHELHRRWMDEVLRSEALTQERDIPRV